MKKALIIIAALSVFVVTNNLRRRGSGKILVTVYVKDGCGYCETFEGDFIPRLKLRGIDVTVRNGESNPFITSFPTIVISRDSEVKLIEGLPKYDNLIKEIKQIEAHK